MTLKELHTLYLLAIFVQLIVSMLCVYQFRKEGRKGKKYSAICLKAIAILLFGCIMVSAYSWYVNYNALKGQLLLNDNKYDLSIEYSERVLRVANVIEKFFPRLMLIKKEKLLFNLGLARYYLNEYDESIICLLASLKIDSRQFMNYVYLAEIYMKQNNIEKALRYYEMITEQEKIEGSFVYYFNVGKSFSYLKKYDEAIEAFNHALHLRPDFKTLHYYLATCYSMKNEKEEAIRNLSIALAYDPRIKELILRDNVFFSNLSSSEAFKKLLEN